jgi:hypothetical protein
MILISRVEAWDHMFVIVLSHDLDIKSGGLGSHVCDCLKSLSRYHKGEAWDHIFVIVLSHDLDIKSGGLGSHVCDCLKS